jgi:tRNA-specific 2-thiouridylase
MKIAHLISGGVDSSVALHLLRAEGHEVTAFYLKIWLEDELSHLGDCPWEEDLRFARAVCEDAGAELEVLPFQRRYHREVVSSALDELRAGGTPSPDVLCNRRIKFGAFFDHLEAERPGELDAVSSGHYARLAGEPGHRRLLRGVDPVKDQTYFLFRLDPHRLDRCRFPVGDLPKRRVRELAHRFGLPNRDRKDSQGICFLGKIPFDEFVRAHLGERPGEIREAGSDRLLGEHRGYWFHTVGQRRGLGLSGGPWYVVGKDVARNVVRVAHRTDLDAHRRDRFRLAAPHWLGTPPAPGRLEVKIRHSPETLGCELLALDPGEAEGGGLEVRLDRPDPGLAAGQAAVLYDGELCLGGGTIVPAEIP